MPLLTSLSCRPLRVGLLVTVALGLAACGGKDDKKAAAGQTVARVNKEELTVHQVNFQLSQQRGLRPEQADAAGRQVLERLIDQELAIQKAVEQKLDRDPRVVVQLEAARRDVLARAYIERVSAAAPKPTPEDVKKYYDENPALFGQRRVYQLQEISIEAKPEKVSELRDALKAAKSVAEFVQGLRNGGVKYSVNQVVRGAEQVPLALLPTLSKMKDGETIFNGTPNGAAILVLVGARAQPVEEAAARPAIEQFLTNERKRKLVTDDLKAMRAAAEIKYFGKFADAPKGEAAAAPAAPTAADVAASAVQAKPESAAPAASASLDSSSISKGLGLK